MLRPNANSLHHRVNAGCILSICAISTDSKLRTTFEILGCSKINASQFSVICCNPKTFCEDLRKYADSGAPRSPHNSSLLYIVRT